MPANNTILPLPTSPRHTRRPTPNHSSDFPAAPVACIPSRTLFTAAMYPPRPAAAQMPLHSSSAPPTMPSHQHHSPPGATVRHASRLSHRATVPFSRSPASAPVAPTSTTPPFTASLSLKDGPARLLAILVPLLVLFLLVTVETSSFYPCRSLHLAQSPDNQASIFHPAESSLRLPHLDAVAAPVAGLAAPVAPVAAAAPDPSTTRRFPKLPACASSPTRARSFIFIFMGHSGSSAILSELNAHSETIIVEREPVDHYHYEFNNTAALLHARAILSRGIAQGKLPGFKMRPNHIKNDPQGWASLARDFETRIVWQYRENLVKQAVGEYSYKYLNDSAVLEGLRDREAVRDRCNRGVGCSFPIRDFTFFHRTLTDCVHSDLAIARGVHLMADGSSCVHALPYEDYLYNREKTMERLLQFLGLKHEKTEPQRFKATSDNLCTVVDNWDELCSNFYGCHVWRHMFDDHHNDCHCQFSTGHVNYCDTNYVP